MPIVANARSKYLERDIKDQCQILKNDGIEEFWVYASNKDFDGNPLPKGEYYLYIGY